MVMFLQLAQACKLKLNPMSTQAVQRRRRAQIAAQQAAAAVRANARGSSSSSTEMNATDNMGTVEANATTAAAAAAAAVESELSAGELEDRKAAAAACADVVALLTHAEGSKERVMLLKTLAPLIRTILDAAATASAAENVRGGGRRALVEAGMGWIYPLLCELVTCDNLSLRLRVRDVLKNLAGL